MCMIPLTDQKFNLLLIFECQIPVLNVMAYVFKVVQASVNKHCWMALTFVRYVKMFLKEPFVHMCSIPKSHVIAPYAFKLFYSS